MLFHHAVALTCIAISLYLGGLIGSIAQLTWITEVSTLFVNARHLILMHGYEKSSKLYILNGLLMALSFAVCRIYFYHKMIFDILVHYVLYRGGSFWSIFYKGKFIQRLAKIAMFLFLFMYLLQLYWFCKILTGLLKAVGIENLSVAGPEDESTDEESDEDKPKTEKMD